MFNSNSPGIIQIIPSSIEPINTNRISNLTQSRFEYNNSQGTDSIKSNVMRITSTDSPQSTRVIKIVKSNPKIINEYSHKKIISTQTLKILGEFDYLNKNATRIEYHELSTIVTKSYSMTFIYKEDFPNFNGNNTQGNSAALNVLVDHNDNNLIEVGAEIVHVQYGKYYPIIYQFNKDFINRIGNNFKITGLSSSLKFDMTEYKLSGNIPFTTTKNIKFTINGTYKFTLTLIVDVREDYDQ